MGQAQVYPHVAEIAADEVHWKEFHGPGDIETHAGSLVKVEVLLGV